MTDFVLPTKGTSEMSKDDQGALLINQATALIVSTYLERIGELQQTMERNIEVHAIFSLAEKSAFRRAFLNLKVSKKTLKRFL